MGTFSQNFEIGLRGVDLRGLTCAPVPDKHLTATPTNYNGETLALRITIEKTTEDAGRRLADDAAHAFFQSIINQFTYDIEEIALPRGVGSSFNPAPEDPGHHAMIVMDQISVHDAITVSITPSQAHLQAFKQRFELGLTVKPFPPAATLYRAKGMFLSGLQSKDKVVRLLILYSAVGLMVPFKNSNNEPSQAEVDTLLRQANPALAYEATGKTKVRKAKTGKVKRASKPTYETLYTKLRNDFVHAEQRGSDPTASIEAIEQNIAAFQRDVAKVLT